MRFTTWSILLLVSLASLNTSVLCQDAVETTETIETEGNVDTSTSDDPTSTLDSDPSASIEEEKQAMQEYGSSDSGASLGDILGAALQSKLEAEETASDEDS